MNANIRTIGGSIGAAVTSVLVTGRLQSSGLPYESRYTHGFTLLAGCSAWPPHWPRSSSPSGARHVCPAHPGLRGGP